MHRHVSAAIPAVALLLAAGAAQARCADDLQALQTRVAHATRVNPTPQSAAAAKVLQKFTESGNGDEVDCYNAVARARRALTAAPPEDQMPKPVDPPPRR